MTHGSSMRSTGFARVAATMDFTLARTRKRDLTLLVITTIGELGSQYTNYWTLNRAQVEENNTLDDLCGDHLATYKQGCSGTQSQRGYGFPNPKTLRRDPCNSPGRSRADCRFTCPNEIMLCRLSVFRGLLIKSIGLMTEWEHAAES